MTDEKQTSNLFKRTQTKFCASKADTGILGDRDDRLDPATAARAAVAAAADTAAAI
jgi:hypothetical protein